MNSLLEDFYGLLLLQPTHRASGLWWLICILHCRNSWSCGKASSTKTQECLNPNHSVLSSEVPLVTLPGLERIVLGQDVMKTL